MTTRTSHRFSPEVRRRAVRIKRRPGPDAADHDGIGVPGRSSCCAPLLRPTMPGGPNRRSRCKGRARATWPRAPRSDRRIACRPRSCRGRATRSGCFATLPPPISRAPSRHPPRRRRSGPSQPSSAAAGGPGRSAGPASPPPRPASLQLVAVQPRAGCAEGIGRFTQARRLPRLLRRRVERTEIHLRRADAGEIHVIRRLSRRHLRRKSEQLANGPLHLHRVALALAQHDDAGVPVQEIEARPSPVAPRTPGPVAVVLADGIADPELADGMLHIRAQVLEGELRRVDADELQAGRRVLLVPALQVGQRAQDVDAGVGPEVHDADLAPQCRGVERRRGVQPFLDGEWWCARSSGLGRLPVRARRGGAER